MSKTIEELRAGALQIKNETSPGANSATRVGGLLSDIVDKLETSETISEEESYNFLKNIPKTGKRIIREENIECNVAHNPGWYQFSYPFLTGDTIKVYVNGTETTDFTTLPHGLVHLGSSFGSSYPEKIEAEYTLITKLEQVCTVPFRNNNYGLWYRAYNQLGDGLYLDWDGTCGKFEIVEPLASNLERAEVSLEYASFDDATLPKSIYSLGCSEYYETFKMYLPKTFHDTAIATLEDRWDQNLSSWWQLAEIKFPSALSLKNGGKSFTVCISWRRGGEIYFSVRDLDYSTEEHYQEQGYVIPQEKIYFPLDQWVDVGIGVKVGPKGVGFVELSLTDEKGNVQYYKEDTLDYCPTKIEESPDSPKSQIDMPKAISMYMDRYIFDSLANCSEPYWKLKDFYCTFYSHNKN